jgi:predicted ATPase
MRVTNVPMRELLVEGVRCFRDQQQIPIRRVTLLVGENSSGKSTVLAMARVAWDLAFGVAEPDFNEQPFDLGGFDAMAHFHGGRGKRVSEFTVEGQYEVPIGPRPNFRNKETTTRTVRGEFRERSGQPVLTRWEVTEGARHAVVEVQDDKTLRLLLERDGVAFFEDQITRSRQTGHLASDAFFAARSRALGVHKAPAKDPKQLALFEQTFFEYMELLPTYGRYYQERPFAGAPIRSKPERTYDPKRGIPEPEGSHVPMDLATMHATEPAEFDRLMEEFTEYGKAANLFSSVEVKRLGKKAGDPFQLMVAIDKFAFNVRDVGYGVSQILPILFDTMHSRGQQTFLLQQPEVHLHPRAQAALGSLLVRQAARSGQRFIVETHSDYLLDRVRMEVRENKIKLPHDEVVILYFERVAGRAKVHPIFLDERGNLVNVPKTYRSFFLDEEKRLLGIDV